MNKLMIGAMALALAVPAMAQTPPEEPKKECCDKHEGDCAECDCCEDMADKDHAKHGEDGHKGHEKH